MQLSARNQIKGTVANIEEGAVNGVVTIDFGGTKIKSVITMEAIKNLNLQVGGSAIAVIKASDVMVGVE